MLSGPRTRLTPCKPLPSESAMSVFSHTAPSLTDFERMAERAFASMPEVFRKHCGGLVIRVADFPDVATLEETGIYNPLKLTGLYDGTPLPAKSVSDPISSPDTVWLFRRPILDEWAARGDVELDRLIEHVLVHEIAHHFGYSDKDIAAIDDWRI